MWSNLTASLASVFGFMAVVLFTMYLFREEPEKLPEDIEYNYEDNSTNPKINKMIDRNAYLHTLAPSYKGAMVGLHNDRRKKRK